MQSNKNQIESAKWYKFVIFVGIIGFLSRFWVVDTFELDFSAIKTSKFGRENFGLNRLASNKNQSHAFENLDVCWVGYANSRMFGQMYERNARQKLP